MPRPSIHRLHAARRRVLYLPPEQDTYERGRRRGIRDKPLLGMQNSLAGWLKKTVSPHTAPPEPQPEVNVVRPAPSNQRNTILRTNSANAENGGITDAQASRPAPTVVPKASHPNITFVPATKDRISEFKRINQLLLPIPYGKSFYDEILSDTVTSSITVLATWTDTATSKAVGGVEAKVVGGIRCRLLGPGSSGVDKTIGDSFDRCDTISIQASTESLNAKPQRHQKETARGETLLYVSTLTLLSPYRHLGIASQLLAQVESVAAEKYGATAVGVHVWEANDEGLEWYGKRGFGEIGREDGYYRRLKPQGAVVMLKPITPAREETREYEAMEAG